VVALASGTHAGFDTASPARSRRHSRSDRDRNSRRRALERGSGHTGTAAPAFPPDGFRPDMDDVRNGWNTLPACMLSTMGQRIKSWNAAPGIGRHRDFRFTIGIAAVRALISACGTLAYGQVARLLDHLGPMQSPRWVRSVGSECLDHLFVFSERNLRRAPSAYVIYYNRCRPRRSLAQKAPCDAAMSLPQKRGGRIVAKPALGGHQIYGLAE
jgi:hypothetical protein